MSIISVIEDVLGVHPFADLGVEAPIESDIRTLFAAAVHKAVSRVEPIVADAEGLTKDLAERADGAVKAVLAAVEKGKPDRLAEATAPAPPAGFAETPETPAAAEPGPSPAAGAPSAPPAETPGAAPAETPPPATS